jgi:hypothetical protein
VMWRSSLKMVWLTVISASSSSARSFFVLFSRANPVSWAFVDLSNRLGSTLGYIACDRGNLSLRRFSRIVSIRIATGPESSKTARLTFDWLHCLIA